MQKLARLLLASLFASTLVGIPLLVPPIASANDLRPLTICTSLKTGAQYISRSGECNKVNYDGRAWHEKGSVPEGTTGSMPTDLFLCTSKKSGVSVISRRTKCNPVTQQRSLWQRPLGPPAAPSIQSITMGLSGTATLAIGAPTDDGGSKITSYRVISSPGGIVTDIPAAQFKTAKITGLIPGTAYSFTVTANNGKGVSTSTKDKGPSTSTKGLGASRPSAASRPTLAPNLPGATVITQAVSTGANSAQLSFTAPASNGGAAITSYLVTAHPGGAQTRIYQAGGGTINITNLSALTNYTFTITAENAAGPSTQPAASTAVTTSAPIPELAAPVFTLSSTSESRAANTAATGASTNSTGGAIASFSIDAVPAGMSFNTTTGALTGTPTSVASATDYTITATNARGSATRKFTLTVTAAVAAPVFTLSSISETRTVSTAATGFTINSTGGAIASFSISATPAGMSFNTTTGVFSGTPTSVASATAYIVTATNTTGTATATFTLTVTVAGYSIGATGPGGGKIFYYLSTGFACGPTSASTCTYLESAPNTWAGGSTDITKIWATTTYNGVDISTIANESVANNSSTGIGLGYKNSVDIVNQGNDTTTAAGAARAYTGGGLGDWYLPTTAELNELCKWANGDVAQPGVGTVCANGTLNSQVNGFTTDFGFVANYYWSSSEYNASRVWLHNFNSGTQGNDGKTSSYYVRPVRAF